MPRRVLAVMLVAALAMSLVGIAGCAEFAESAAEKAVKGATGIDVDSDEGEVTLEGDDGSSTTIDTENATLPDGWPKDAPVYDGTIESSWETSNDKGTSFSVALSTTDPVQDVVAWYTGELEGEGWKIVSTYKDDSSGMVSVEKGDITFYMAAGAGSDTTDISVMVGPKQ
ncbi:MAG: hypothetical protein WBI63_10535 [Coriobacteriia bacterium]